MFSRLKAVLGRLAAPAEAPAVSPVEYKGYRIHPAPYLNSSSSYQTAGTIEKDTPEGPRRHEFVRADTYDSRDAAVAFTISKAKQLIDQLGERMFNR
jgi:hypothetical protein